MAEDFTPLPEETYDSGDLDRCEIQGCNLKIARHMYCRMHGEMIQREADMEFARLRNALGLNPVSPQPQQYLAWKSKKIDRLLEKKKDIHKQNREKKSRQRHDVSFNTSQKHRRLSEF